MKYCLSSFKMIALIIPALLIQCKSEPVAEKPPQVTPERQTLRFVSSDSLEITADLYLNKDRTAPFIILFHQARYSRGEYREIAPKLVSMGFSCMSLDQRSGQGVNDVENETHKRAAAAGKGTDYVDALPDLVAAVEYVKAEFLAEQVIIWGSSYSASLSFVLANIKHTDISGLVAFSPGSYFELDGKSIPDYASTITCPVFMTSSREEGPSRMEIFEAIPHDQKTFYIPESEGYHGSKALWTQHEGYEAYWSALVAFLKPFLEKE